MARKNNNNGSASGSGPVRTPIKTTVDIDTKLDTTPAAITATATNATPALGSIETDPAPTVFVNNANLTEIKGALDDIVKKQLLAQSFTPSLLHPTVHLTLGYTSILFALGASLYSFRVTFEDSKPALWIGVTGYFLLQGVLWAWKRWVEKGEVFRGKRRRMVKRIETDHIQIISTTSLLPPTPPNITHSPHTRPSSPTSVPSSPSSISSPAFDSNNPSHPRDISSGSASSASSGALGTSPSSTSISSASSSSSGPTYCLHLTLSTTSNNGKSLLRKSRVLAGKGIGELIDEIGGVEEGEVSRWLGGLLGEAGLVGAEEGEGTKEE